MNRLFTTLITALLIWHSQPTLAAEAGDRAPSFTLRDQTGEVRTLEEFSGKVLLLDFWASWCPPCLQSLPWLDSVQKEYEGKGFVVVAVNLDRDFSKPERFLKKLKISHLQVLQDPTGELANTYDVPTMPTSYLIDRTGNIVLRHKGFRSADKETLKVQIEKVLGK
ncbi:MAG: TlpA family protein disulfide reductase [Bdellovibrionales bacterium]|nr:TlpA family protein disulfide reductase [Bdellovibrionales bacterium]